MILTELTDIEPRLKKYINIDNYYSYVKQHLNLGNFFIAGGSIVDLINNNEYSDIDLFFETENDFNHALLQIKNKYAVFFETENAVTFKTDLGEVQLVKLYFCSPLEMMSTFDINKSRIALTSSGIVRGNDYDKDVCIDYNNFTSKTPGRLEKYRQKGYIIDISLYKDVLNYLISNKERKFKGYYNGLDEVGNGLNVISKGINLWNLDDNVLLNLILTFIDSLNDYDSFVIINRCSKIIKEESKNIDLYVTLMFCTDKSLPDYIYNRYMSIPYKDRLSKDVVKKIYPEYFL